MVHPSFRIPASLAKTILVKRKTNQLRVWLALKMLYGFQVHRKDLDTYKVAALAGLGERCVRNYLHKLASENWIGVKDQTLFLRPIGFLYQLYGLGGRSSVVIHFKDLKHLKEVLFVLTVLSLIRYRRYRGSHTEDRNQLHLFRVGDGEIFNANTLSLRYLAKHLQMSHTSVEKLKKKAMKLGLLKRKKTFQDLSPAEYCYCFHHPKFGCRIRFRKWKNMNRGRYTLLLADELYPVV